MAGRVIRLVRTPGTPFPDTDHIALCTTAAHSYALLRELGGFGELFGIEEFRRQLEEVCGVSATTRLHVAMFSTAEGPGGPTGTISSDPVGVFDEVLEGFSFVSRVFSTFGIGVSLGDAGIRPAPSGIMSIESELSGVCAGHRVTVPELAASPFVRTAAGATNPVTCEFIG